MLLTGQKKTKIRIDTPKGISYEPDIVDIRREECRVSCAVVKDGGDDSDITSGARIYVSVRIAEAGAGTDRKAQIRIDGGTGVGRVTKPGLDQPVGNAAINHVPREMMEKEVTEVCDLCDFHGILEVTVSVPEGEALAGKTFNPRLGIVGGISILGTSGIVEPMSERALLETIRVELSQKRAEGNPIAAVSPGNYGLEYMKRMYGYDLDRSVKCSNFIGDTLDMAGELGFEGVLLTGHIGKLVKLSGGIMNTHSKEGDCRMELLAAAAIREGVPLHILQRIIGCVTTEEAVRILEESGKREAVMKGLMERILFYLGKRAAGRLQVECILYSNEFGGLAKSAGADEYLNRLRNLSEPDVI